MQRYTFSFSILVHLVLVGVLIVSPALVDVTLPEPRRALAYTIVEAVAVPTIPAPPRTGTRTPGVNPHAAPLVAPDAIAPETPFEPFEHAGSDEGVVGGIPSDGVPGSIIADVPPPPPPLEKPAGPVRIGGSIRQPQKIRHVAPTYPSIAQSARVAGTVILDAAIGEDGRITNLRVLRSIPLLDHAAIEAVRQWQFTPTLLNGRPMPVVMTVTVTFTLQP